MREPEVMTEHTRYSFHNVLPDNPRTAYNADVVIIYGSERLSVDESTLTRSNSFHQKFILLGRPLCRPRKGQVGRRGRKEKTEKLDGREGGQNQLRPWPSLFKVHRRDIHSLQKLSETLRE